MKTRSYKISINKAIDRYYKRHKDILDNLFGDEKRAKSHLKNDVPNMPSESFKKYGNASKKFNDYIESKLDPETAMLKQAKRDAINRDIWVSQSPLNKRIDKNGFQLLEKAVSINNDLFYTDGYYEVKNTEYVLAKGELYRGNGETYSEQWRYIKKDELGL